LQFVESILQLRTGMGQMLRKVIQAIAYNVLIMDVRAPFSTAPLRRLG